MPSPEDERAIAHALEALDARPSTKDKKVEIKVHLLRQAMVRGAR